MTAPTASLENDISRWLHATTLCTIEAFSDVTVNNQYRHVQISEEKKKKKTALTHSSTKSKLKQGDRTGDQPAAVKRPAKTKDRG